MTKYLKHFLYLILMGFSVQCPILNAEQVAPNTTLGFLQKLEEMQQDLDKKLNTPLPATDYRKVNAFGFIQLTSCTTALRKRGPLYFGAEIIPNQGWQIQNVNLEPTTEPALPIELFHPFEQPYPERTIYPISALSPKNPDKPLNLSVMGTLTACQTQILNPKTQEMTEVHPPKCTLYPVDLKLSLPVQQALITPDCAAITHALSFVPAPMRLNQIAGFAVQTEKNQAELTLDFQKKPKSLMIFDKNKTKVTPDIQVDKKRAVFKLPVEPNQSEISLFVRTFYRYYELSLPIHPAGTPKPQIPFSWPTFLQSCLLTLLCSTLPIFWARYTDNTKKQFLNQTKLMIELLLVMALALTLWISINGALPLDKMLLSKSWTIGLMLAGLLFIPINAVVPITLWIIAPKPFLADIITTSAQLALIFVVWLTSTALFSLQLIYAKKIVPYLKNPKEHKVWICSRLAWIGLIIYTLLYL